MASDLASEPQVAAAQEDGGIKRVTRRQLYDLVWTTPVRTLAKKFGLSDVGLAKTCQRYEIPRPPVGYWTKVRQGKRVHKPGLRQNEELDRSTITFDLRPRQPAEAPEEAPPVVRPPDIAAAIEKIEAIVPINVPNEVVSPHKFVALTDRALRQSMRSGKKDRFGFVAPPWDYAHPTLRITVMEESVQRALRIANAFVRGAIAGGIKVECIKEDRRERVCLKLLGESFEFSISERRRQVPHVLTAEERDHQKKYKHLFGAPKFDYKSTGDLTLSVWPAGHYYRAKVWKDGKRSHLEEIISQVLLELPTRVQKLRQGREAQRLAEIERQKEQRQRWDEERRRREEQERVDALLENVRDWRTAENVRRYASVVEEALRERASMATATFKNGWCGRTRWLIGSTRSAKSASRISQHHQIGHGEEIKRCP